MSRPRVPPLLGAGAVIAPIIFALVPGAHLDNPLYQQIGLWVLAWQALIFAGGVLIIAGWWTGRLDVEAAGLVIAACGYFEYIIAVLIWQGQGVAFWAITFGSCVGAMVGRVDAALRGRKL